MNRYESSPRRELYAEKPIGEWSEEVVYGISRMKPIYKSNKNTEKFKEAGYKYSGGAYMDMWVADPRR